MAASSRRRPLLASSRLTLAMGVAAATLWTRVAAASDSLPCKRAGRDALSCWDTRLTLRPSAVPGAELARVAPSNSREIVITSDRACAIDRTDAVWCWGDNDSGQLGDGTRKPAKTPRRVRGLADVTAVALGRSMTCALTRSGAVACWGFDDARSAYQTQPAGVHGLKQVVELAAGYGHACARRSDGTVWCWGYNRYGQLGDGTQKDRAHPVRVAGLAGAVELAAGDYHTCARVHDGSVWCWGNGWGGEDGTEDRLLRPARVAEIRGASAILASPQGFVAAQRNGAFVSCRYHVEPNESEASPAIRCRAGNRPDIRGTAPRKVAVISDGAPIP